MFCCVFFSFTFGFWQFFNRDMDMRCKSIWTGHDHEIYIIYNYCFHNLYIFILNKLSIKIYFECVVEHIYNPIKLIIHKINTFERINSIGASYVCPLVHYIYLKKKSPNITMKRSWYTTTWHAIPNVDSLW